MQIMGLLLSGGFMDNPVTFGIVMGIIGLLLVGAVLIFLFREKISNSIKTRRATSAERKEKAAAELEKNASVAERAFQKQSESPSNTTRDVTREEKAAVQAHLDKTTSAIKNTHLSKGVEEIEKRKAEEKAAKKTGEVVKEPSVFNVMGQFGAPPAPKVD